jgi:cation-transporting ATPase E
MTALPAPVAATDPEHGLTSTEAAARHARGLGNDYRPPTSRGYWEIFRDNAVPLVNGPLLLVAGLLVAFGAYTEAVLTGGPVFANIGIGVVQGTRAKRQLDAVALLARPKATVVRDRTEQELDRSEIVMGDLVVARRGDEIPLDGRIVGDGRASLDESALTGESDPIDKGPGDRVLSGTAVVSGTARFEVDAVGADTFANKILSEAKGRASSRTPLQTDIGRAVIGVAALILLSAVIVVLSVQAVPGETAADSVLAAAVLVTLVPQGLALMLTVTYAAAAVRISRLGALAQRQSAIEAMSRIDTFCSDKTGTLTTQRITFAGAEPIGRSAEALPPVLAAIAASTEAPNATTRALAAAHPGTARPIEEEVPFSSALRWSAIRFTGSATDTTDPAADATAGGVFVLGAPAVLLPHTADNGMIARRAVELASVGHRVLLLARGPASAKLLQADTAVLPSPLELVALLMFEEELRPEASATIDGLIARGIDVKIVSGDDPHTVQAIGRRLGLSLDTEAVSGMDLAALDDEQLGEVATRTTVFGRVDPQLKARLVSALQVRGRNVAMTGDGVNDILPVRRADVGVAMQSGSPATRGVADLVLIRDDFSILPEAIKDGQRIVAAMGATLVVLLARTFYTLLIIVGASLLQLPFPFTPRQNSALALVTVGVPILVLALWVKPVPSRHGLLFHTLRTSIPLSLGVAALGLPVYAAALGAGAPESFARTILTTVAAFMGIGLLSLIPVSADVEGRVRMPAWVRTVILVGAMTLLYLLALATDAGRGFFQLTPLPVEVVATLGVLAGLWTVIVLLVHQTKIVQRAIDRGIDTWASLRLRTANA